MVSKIVSLESIMYVVWCDCIVHSIYCSSITSCSTLFLSSSNFILSCFLSFTVTHFFDFSSFLLLSDFPFISVASADVEALLPLRNLKRVTGAAAALLAQLQIDSKSRTTNPRALLTTFPFLKSGIAKPLFNQCYKYVWI